MGPRRKLTFIHTVATLEPVFACLAAERLQGWELEAVTDESLLSRTIEKGRVDQDVSDSLARHVEEAGANGSSAIIVTCSTLGEAVDALAPSAAAPLYRIDRGMAECAVLQASTIGILATLGTTLEPTTRLLEATAQAGGRRCTFVSRLCGDAFAVLKSGDRDRHDDLVRQAFEELSRDVELVVLAQASMARALDQAKQGETYLTSPRLGMDYIAGLLRL
jgi:Asp/Glu/hydantoin racemase